jgi:probable rRNA maturation factor
MVLMDVTINDLYGYKENYDYLNNVIDIALKEENVKNAIFSIIFVSEERIHEINRDYRGIDRVTDVISFAFEDTPDRIYDDFRFLGEIYICIPRMIEQANMYGHSEMRELAFLTVHGILHLLGYDHMTKEEEEIMFSKQELILDAANIKR